MYPIPWLALFLAAALFCLGMFGVLVRRNALVVLIVRRAHAQRGEPQRSSPSARHGPDPEALTGHVSAFFVIAVAAAEAAIGLAIVIAVFRSPRLRERGRHPDDEALNPVTP